MLSQDSNLRPFARAARRFDIRKEQEIKTHPYGVSLFLGPTRKMEPIQKPDFLYFLNIFKNNVISKPNVPKTIITMGTNLSSFASSL